MGRKRSRNITKDDVRFVYENYGRMTHRQMAEQLGISYYQVARIVNSLRQKGVDLPTLRASRNPIDEFVAELKSEQM